ncbi:hypothetical protein CGH99_21395 [Vibrio parahaemolyticus]|uniref:hypothetical protein n=1 Tax=Vibrio parahaemolyticus TaxID=670 RepID=UPI00111FB24D|nr:hypothetical protein [Vibrio parahaemolyticus]TOL36004.1 hypothetical protein CGH99_21395 [Vibrio parahaemolyticus]TOL48286.1 hypothetical protein CGH96_21035 [Vibrio parahaemolyticus]TOL68012.1 hypothetical protein CGH92_20320 [Vibrio parahaemolyticus]TON28663.1 hypothetical protein CGH62_19630 [Vibrio parahaemolyticus]TOO67835.1 hypothetical protein CGH32_16895 [Vibrio parahaemolyticus]
MIKNFTLISQPVKLQSDGVMMRERYLLSEQHANHKHSDALISLVGCAETSHRIALAGEKFRLEQQLKRKGGRPLSSYAMEYCLTLPRGYRPSIEQWQSITSDCCIKLAKYCKLTKAEFAHYRQQIRAVLHQQNQEGQKGTGDHVHLIIGKVVRGRVLKELQKKGATKLLKQTFNHAVLQHVGIDYRSYEPIEKEKGRRLSTWQYQYEKANQALEIEKLIKKMQSQFDKWLKAKEEHNNRQQHRQKNRLLKTYEELKLRKLSPLQQEKLEKIKQKIK